MNRTLILAPLFWLSVASVTAQAAPAPQAEIPGVIRAGAQVQLVKDGLKGLEGPVPSGDGGLYFTAIEENRIYKLDRDGSTVSIWRENTNATNGLYLLKDGRMLGAEGGGKRVIAIAPNGTVTALATASGGAPLRGPNDLIADSKGGIYFTDPAPRPAPNVAPMEPGNVNYRRADGEVIRIDSEIRRPNGLTISPDQRTLYVGDTEGEYVYAFDIQPDGSARNKRQFVKLLEPVQGSLGLRSGADGMALDSDGRLYVSTAAGIQVIAPNGNHLGIIRLPAGARNVAFAGPDRRTLYLTALNALYRVQVLSSGPADRSK
jgi:gluconolactonase